MLFLNIDGRKESPEFFYLDLLTDLWAMLLA